MLRPTIAETNFATKSNFIERWCEYALINLPFAAKCHHAGAVKFSGQTSLVVGPGPSITKALPVVKKLQGKVLIIALQRIARRLLESGITPDVIVALDHGDIVVKHLRGLDLSNTVLALDYSVNPALFKLKARKTIVFNGRTNAVPGNKYVVAPMPEMEWYYNLFKSVSHIHVGFTISSAGVGLSILWGCTRIMLVGVDLAHSGGNRYADSKGVIRDPCFVPAWPDGKKRAPSEHDLELTHRWMRRIAINYDKIMFIQCSEGGSYIPGFRHRALWQMEKVLRKQCDFGAAFDALGDADGSYTRDKLAGALPAPVEAALTEASKEW